MKKVILAFLILLLLLFSACSQKEQEKVELYEKEFQETTENWDVNFYVTELPKEDEFSERSSLKLKYLKETEQEISLKYEFKYGDPPSLTISPSENEITENKIFEITFDDHKI